MGREGCISIGFQPTMGVESVGFVEEPEGCAGLISFKTLFYSVDQLSAELSAPQPDSPQWAKMAQVKSPPPVVS